MDKENFFTHVENLAPGLATLALIAIRVPATTNVIPNSTVLMFFQQPFVTGLLVVATAYLLGVFVFVISRLIVDTLSAFSFRPLLLKLYHWHDFDSLSLRETNQKYRDTIEVVLKKDKDDAIRQEVSVRRQRGRLLRTLVIPLILLMDAALNPLMLTVGIVCFVAVYSYAEVSIYQEARHWN